MSGCVGLTSLNSVRYETKYGVYVETSAVSTACLTPRVRLALKATERKFNQPAVVTSGYRSPWRNGSVGGARKSLHMKCQAVDVFVPGVSKARLIKFMRRQSVVGGIGCYPGRKFIHIDVRKRPAGAAGPLMFSGC
ncbi:MAG: YcbK family protein [Alphaproteobacteria bacterium]|nr:YcbK family protein [Alphaproteobacteria bacterium]